MILFVLLWCLGFQDASWPDLPPKLKANQELVQEYPAALQKGTAEERRNAAERIFAELQQADPAAAADFLLGLAARDDLNEIVDLKPVLERHQLAWNPFSARIEEVLVHGLEHHATPAEAALVHGALRAAGMLELEHPSRVEAIAAFLDVNGFGPDARRALVRITRREFRHRAAFDAWWQDARALPRLDWVLSQADAATLEVISLWRDLIAANPAQALDALQHERVEIRLLALSQLAAVPGDATDGSGRAVTEVVTAALSGEVEPRVQVELVRMVPRLYPVEAQVEVLQDILADNERSNAVRTTAAEVLAQASDSKQAALAFVAELSTAYAPGMAENWGPPSVRVKLISSLHKLVNVNEETARFLRAGGKADPGPNEASVPDGQRNPLQQLEGALATAFAYEQSPEMLQALCRLVGVVGTDQSFLSTLGGLVPRQGLAIEARQATIEAFGAVAGRVGVEQAHLDLLHGLLNDENDDVRFAAAGALGSTGVEAAFVMLADRLSLKTENTAMQNRLLRQLGKGRVPATVGPLLKYDPSEKQRSLYRDVLDKQIERDEGLRLQAMESLYARADYELAWRLDAQLSDQLEAETPDLEREALRARVQTAWVLNNPIPPTAEDRQVAEAFRRVNWMREKQPQDSSWPLLLAQVHLRLNQDAQAFGLLEAALPGLPTGTELDRLALAALQAAERAELAERGVALAEGLKPMSTPEAQAALAEVVGRLKPAENLATSDPQGSPPPADDGSGAETPTEAPAKPQEQPATEDPGKQPEPEAPKTDDPQPSGSGGGGGKPEPETGSQEPAAQGDGSGADGGLRA